MSSFSPRLFSFAAAVLAGSCMLLCSGCGKSTADAQTPPPQSLSEPVRAADPSPVVAPAIPVSVSTDDALVQRAPDSQPLPTFIEPKPAPAAAIAPAPVAPPTGNNRYHVLAKGETLYALSRKYNVKVNKIMEANQFKDPNHLAIGTKVYIPN